MFICVDNDSQRCSANSTLGLCSLSGQMSLCKISWRFEANTSGFRLCRSLGNLTGKFQIDTIIMTSISRLRYLMRSWDKTSVCLRHRGWDALIHMCVGIKLALTWYKTWLQAAIPYNAIVCPHIVFFILYLRFWYNVIVCPLIVVFSLYLRFWYK